VLDSYLKTFYSNNSNGSWIICPKTSSKELKPAIDKLNKIYNIWKHDVR